MKLLSNTEQFEHAILNIAKANPKFFFVSTFGLRVDDFLKMVIKVLPKDCVVKFLVGVNEDISKSKLIFLKTFFAKNNITYKITTNHHIKLIISDKSVIIGSSNLTRSNWSELNVLLTDKNSISKMRSSYLKTYEKSKSLKNGRK